MEIKIDIDSNGFRTVVRVAGRLCGKAVEELKKACDPIEGPLVIDLSHLFLADKDGISAVRSMADKGAQICGASPFVQLLLDSAPGLKTGDKESP